MGHEFVDGAPYLVRVRALFEGVSPANPDVVRNRVYRLPLNSNEDMVLEDYVVESKTSTRDLLICSLRRDAKYVFSCELGERGLEYVSGYPPLKLSFNGSEGVDLDPALKIGPGSTLRPVVDEYGQSVEFQKLAGNVVGWLEKVVKEKKIGEIPLMITTLIDQRTPGQLKAMAVERTRSAYFNVLKTVVGPSREEAMKKLIEAKAMSNTLIDLGIITPVENREMIREAFDRVAQELKESEG